MPAPSTTRRVNRAARTVGATEEKVSLNLGVVDLGQIDLLVEEGFYANRSDFIRTAIRQRLGEHQPVVREVAGRRTLALGLHHFDRERLQACRDRGERLSIQVLGLATIADDVTPELALATIESITVLGALHAPAAVKAALAARGAK